MQSKVEKYNAQQFHQAIFCVPLPNRNVLISMSEVHCTHSHPGICMKLTLSMPQFSVSAGTWGTFAPVVLKGLRKHLTQNIPLYLSIYLYSCNISLFL